MVKYVANRYPHQLDKSELLSAIGATDLTTDDIAITMDVYRVEVEVTPRELSKSEKDKLRLFLEKLGYVLK